MSFRFSWAAYTKEDLVAVDEVRDKVYRKKEYDRKQIRIIIYAAIFAAMMVVGLMALCYSLESWKLIAYNMVAVSLLTVRYYVVCKLKSNLSYDLQDPRRGELTITLNETELVERNALTETHFTYPAFTSAYHCRGRYILFINDSTSAVILPEEALKEGDPAALRAFLESKLESPIVEMK